MATHKEAVFILFLFLFLFLFKFFDDVAQVMIIHENV
jgi:hypothetical protein